ncbi:MAG: hypothetical protein GQ564_02100 [Bacteroidales bacterium]|nr:hypothetical protein [Bacteroidales bacterium]
MEIKDLISSDTIKVVTIIGTTILGIIGVLFDYKNKKTGHLNIPGYLVIFLMFIMATIAFIGQRIEYSSKIEAALVQLGRHEDILDQTHTILDSLQNTTEIQRIIDKGILLNQDSINKSLEKQAELYESSQITLSKIDSNTIGQNVLIKKQKGLVKDLHRNIYALNPDKIKFSYRIYWKTDHEDVKKYLTRITDFAKNEISSNQIDTFLLWKKYDNENMKIKYKINNKGEIRIKNITIKSNSNYLPNCQDYYESRLASFINNQRLYIAFSKGIVESGQPTLSKPYLRYLMYSCQDTVNCFSWNWNDIPKGESNIELQIQYENNEPEFLVSEHMTNRVKLDMTSGQLFSALDLLEADLVISGFPSGEKIPVGQVSDFSMSLVGEDIPGMKIRRSWDYWNDEVTFFQAKHKIAREDFQFNIFQTD